MKKKNFEKLKNPNGPYKIKFTFKGVDITAIIDNNGPFDFKIKFESRKSLSAKFLDNLKNYLEAEGFYEAATKHNLHW